ncbi:hypothetical protein CVT26_012369 [Gymnopilus dilepis]|uniref:Uncharacterized protein n=1 Tax=Gymnopilus dilepis TaxID=231916 RepID=A0A409X0G2_9AGAR|nr:hypothetical protein CVT26_012369 [Gymnopilus dilepis]
MHRLYCALTLSEKTAIAYDAKHRNLLLTIAHNLYEFDRLVHLQGPDHLRFLAVVQNSFLHVKLRPVENPPPGRENSVALLDAQVVNISVLSDHQTPDTLERVERHFPTLCFGYSIVDANGLYRSISTVRHPFRWPYADGSRPLKLQKAVNLIRLFERMWALEAQVEQEERERRRLASLWQKSHLGSCWMTQEGSRMAGEEVERSWASM